MARHADTTGFWSGRRVAITGATGFVGHHVAQQLTAAGADVVALVRAGSRRQHLEAAGIRCTVAPLEDSEAIESACAGCDAVFHLAGAVDFHEDWDRFRCINVNGSLNVARAARAAGVRRLIHTSSIVAIGHGSRECPLDEAATWNLGHLRIPYATTKREAEEQMLALGSEGPEVVVVNPTCVVGPDDWSGSEFGTLCRRFWKGRVPLYFSGGNNFVDVRDVAAGHLLAAEHGRPGQRYILGGENLTYGEFFAALESVEGRRRFRIGLPAWAGRICAAVESRWTRPDKRPYLSPGQARLMGLYLHVRSRKAEIELEYTARTLAESLCDTHRFWETQARSASEGSASLACASGLCRKVLLSDPR